MCWQLCHCTPRAASLAPLSASGWAQFWSKHETPWPNIFSVHQISTQDLPEADENISKQPAASSTHTVQLPIAPFSFPSCLHLPLTCSPLQQMHPSLSPAAAHCIASAITTTRQNYPEPPLLSCHQHRWTPRYIIVSHTEVQYEVWSTKPSYETTAYEDYVACFGPGQFLQMTAGCESNFVTTRRSVIVKAWMVVSSIYRWYVKIISRRGGEIYWCRC